MGSRVDYEAPSRWCTTMAYSADVTKFINTFSLFLKVFLTTFRVLTFWNHFRLFSCGTIKDGESHIVEWNESEGAVKRTYLGFRKRSLGVVQFDTTKNRF
ncbi:putative Topless family protein [Helianthus annuus]|uniref:Topless family protein n=1 Tax=Helianthus annuus TaxID=4232 RepID=A0A9K3DK61_HELAN|nr:putative Topless family protein [Helianthus annuus]KAJ0429441.1 putative Topless family protein [Helianthus annuus]KAJ0636579.1 putative Topless family protein [Helianthus annuus]KAJ0807478.1 putative Topless family protein [Helianthus annuus]KAJ0813404.1 putative Topless family protein [Helianthus annuus]